MERRGRKDREADRQTDRDREIERQRQRKTHRDTQKERFFRFPCNVITSQLFPLVILLSQMSE